MKNDLATRETHLRELINSFRKDSMCAVGFINSKFYYRNYH